MATIDDVKASYKAVIRVDLNDAAAAATAAAIDGGQLTLAQYQTSLIQQSAPTTQAALLLSSLVTGTVPTSAKLDELTAFAKTQNDYYTNVLKSSNAQLGAYEALGRAYASDATTTAAFSARFGALSTADFVTAAYSTAFNTAPSAGAAANLIGQVNYFTSLYTAAGIPAAQASLQAKGAVFGQIVGYAATAPAAGGTSTLDDQSIATLQTIANQAVSKIDSTVYGKALPGVSGAAIILSANGSVSLDVAANGNGANPNVGNVKATTGNDTVSGTISSSTTAVTINTAAGDDTIGSATTAVTLTEVNANKISIDGSAGNDTLYAKLGAAATSATSIANVEKIYLDGANFAADAKNWTGVQELWAFNTTGATTVTNIASGTKVGIENSTTGASFTFADGVASAALTLKNAAGAVTATGNTAFKTLTVDVSSKSEITTLTSVAETITVTGSGALSIANVTNGAVAPATAANVVKTFDASAATGVITLGSAATPFDSSIASTIKLGSAADALNVKFTGQFKDTITLGAGNDTVTVKADGAADFTNVKLTSGTITSFADFADFTKGDKITVDFAAAAGAATSSVVGQANLEAAIAALNTAEGTKTAAGIVFEFSGSTYLYKDVGADGLNDGDGLIKLAGTGYTIGATGDINLV